MNTLGKSIADCAKLDWDAPSDDGDVLHEIASLLRNNTSLTPHLQVAEQGDVDAKYILSFPFQQPHPTANEALMRGFRINANNINTRLQGGKGSEGGFAGSQELERRVLAMTAELLGAEPESVDGFMTSGATTATMAAMLIGRDKQRTAEQHCRNSTAVFCSFLTHYSVDRAAKVLNIAPHGASARNNDGTGICNVGTDERGRVLVNRIAESIEDTVHAHPNVTHFIVVASAGTTMLGSVDDIPQLSTLLGECKCRFPDKTFHLHVDAAFGAFVAPFVEGVPDIGFRNPHVDTIALDYYKSLGLHVGEAALLVRKDQAEASRSSSAIVPGSAIGIEGSRPGAMAAACYAILRMLGKEGLRSNAEYLMGLTAWVRTSLSDMGIPLFPSDLPIVGVRDAFPVMLREKYIVHEQGNFPAVLSDPHPEQCLTDIWNVVVMPHVTAGIEQFIEDYRALLHARRLIWCLS